jgi:16S rRNA (uracil1498-N3)-methyltransferase
MPSRLSLPRLHVATPLAPGLELDLPDGAARHVQVLRLQPGALLSLFDGRGGEWQAEVTAMGRREVSVRVGEHAPIERELPLSITLALGMPANERMDTVVEKSTELGAAALQPLVCERSVLRVEGDRAQRKAQHWQAIAVAACEQCGRNQVPVLAPPRPLRDWLEALPPPDASERRFILSLADGAPALAAVAPPAGRVILLSGPEGGLSDAEEARARAVGFEPVTLGPRVLRADTAPLAAVAALAALAALAASTASAAPAGLAPVR